jgi:O-antigen ligase
MVATALLLAAPGVVGWTISMSDGFDQSLGAGLLIACAAAACVAIMLTGSVGCLIAVSAVQIVGFMPVLTRVGRVDFTLADLFYVGLVGWWSTQLALGRRRHEPMREVRLGEWAAILFLAYIGVTTIGVLLLEPKLFATSAVSWIRLVQTASLAWLAASVIHTVRELRLLINAIALAAVASIGVAVGDALRSGVNLSARYGGLLGPDAFGLVSGLLIVLAVVGGGGSRTSHRAAFGAMGVLGLVMSRSQGALVGTALVVALALVTAGGSRTGALGTRSRIQRLNRGLLAAACAAVVVVAAIQFLRPGSLPTSSKFRESSVYNRIIVGTAGLEIFSEHPFLGVGWRRSDSPTVIASPDLAAKLRKRFSTPTETFFPDVEITSVHNTYVQLLAELGLVGTALFGIAVWAVGRRVLALVRSLGKDTESWRQARFLTFAALLSLVWLNDNPLYGGQPETVLLAVALGSLVALARLPTEAEEVRAAAEAPHGVRRRDDVMLRGPDRPTKRGTFEERRMGRRIATDDRLQPARPEPDAGKPRTRRLEFAELEADFALEALRGLVSEVQREVDLPSEELEEPRSTVEPASKRRGLLRRRGRGRAR